MRLTALAALGCLLPALASAATVTIALDDPALQRSQNWGTQLARTQHKGSTLSFSFTGVAISIILNTYHTYGVVTITLDGEDTTLDTYNDVGHIDSVCGLCKDGLTATKHNVVLTLDGPGQGQSGSGQAWMNIRSINYETGNAEPASPPGGSTSSPTPSEPPASDSSTTPSSTATDSSSAHSPSNSLSTGQETNDPQQANRSSKPLNAAATAGVVVASVAVAGIILLVLLWLLRRRRRQRQAQWDPHEQFVTPDPFVVYPAPQSPGSGSGKILRPAAARSPTSSSPFFAAQTTSPTASPVGTRYGDMQEADGGVRAELAQIRADLSRLAHPPQYTTQ